MALVFAAFLAAGARGEEQPPLPEIEGPDREEELAPPPLPDVGEPLDEGELAPPPLPDVGAPEAPPVALEPSGWPDYLDRQLGRLPVPVHGFSETRIGPRVVDDGDQPGSFSLAESRLRLETDPFYGGLQFNLKADFICDFVVTESRIELREANAAFSPFGFMDVKAGRQILT
ncbi:MAG: hypothetical protein KAX19_13065, partial [Candidatus Brocadiae bacterium]|nr:hypothetical protein [Candidatus Brocadiia bacterium]